MLNLCLQAFQSWVSFETDEERKVKGRDFHGCPEGRGRKEPSGKEKGHFDRWQNFATFFCNPTMHMRFITFFL